MHGPDGWGSFAAVPNMIAEILPQLREAAPVILSLIIIEGLLSVDNMLAIATLASQLPEKQKKLALRTGLAGAYVFRGVALFFVGFIMANEWIKFLGAFYLIHLMAEHFSNYAAEHDDDPATVPKKPRTFWPTVFAIQLMDLSLSVDNVVAAVATVTEALERVQTVLAQGGEVLKFVGDGMLAIFPIADVEFARMSARSGRLTRQPPVRVHAAAARPAPAPAAR